MLDTLTLNKYADEFIKYQGYNNFIITKITNEFDGFVSVWIIDDEEDYYYYLSYEEFEFNNFLILHERKLKFKKLIR